MDAISPRTHHAPVRVLPHIKRLDDCFGDFVVRVVCECGAVREIQAQALARLVGWKVTLKELALRLRSRSAAGTVATPAGGYTDAYITIGHSCRKGGHGNG